MTTTEVKIAVVRAWNDAGSLRIRIVLESPTGGERLAFSSVEDAVGAIQGWLAALATDPLAADIGQARDGLVTEG